MYAWASDARCLLFWTDQVLYPKCCITSGKQRLEKYLKIYYEHKQSNAWSKTKIHNDTCCCSQKEMSKMLPYLEQLGSPELHRYHRKVRKNLRAFFSTSLLVTLWLIRQNLNLMSMNTLAFLLHTLSQMIWIAMQPERMVSTGRDPWKPWIMIAVTSY